MTELFDSGGLRVAAYLLAAAAAVAAGLRERRRIAATGADLWPTFWFLSAALLVSLGVARWMDLAGILTDLGRTEARAEGWYEVRRGIQAAVIVGITVVWAISVVVAVWRVPERRRRYLPAAVVAFTIVCFAMVRSISLHHVDAVLDRRVGEVRLRAWAELGLLALLTITTVWFPFVRDPPSPSRVIPSGAPPPTGAR